MPRQDRLRSDNLCDFLQRFASEPLGNLRQTDALRISELNSISDLISKDSILHYQILIPKQEFFVNRAGDICEHSLPVHQTKLNQYYDEQATARSDGETFGWAHSSRLTLGGIPTTGALFEFSHTTRCNCSHFSCVMESSSVPIDNFSNRNLFGALLAAFMLSGMTAGCLHAPPYQVRPVHSESNAPKVGLYSDRGVKRVSAVAAHHMFEWMGMSVETITSDRCQQDFFCLFQIPNGSTDPYNRTPALLHPDYP